jgi:hypothetical protein
LLSENLPPLIAPLRWLQHSKKATKFIVITGISRADALKTSIFVRIEAYPDFLFQ